MPPLRAIGWGDTNANEAILHSPPLPPEAQRLRHEPHSIAKDESFLTPPDGWAILMTYQVPPGTTRDDILDFYTSRLSPEWHWCMHYIQTRNVETEERGVELGGADFTNQYSGPKAAALPAYHALSAVAESLGPDVMKVVQKTGVSFRRKKQFALIQAPSAKRLRLGLNLAATPDDPRIVAASGMFSHSVDVTSPDEVDADVAAWVRAAYDRAG